MRKLVFTILLSVTILSLFTINYLEESSAALTPTYRTIDGSGNHPSNQGQANQPLLRSLTIGYQDGLSIPRGGDPSNLPSARAISNAVSAQSSSVPDPSGASDMFWLWGQFVDHDIDLTGGTNEFFPILVACGDEDFDPNPCIGNVVIPLTRSVWDPNTGPLADPPIPREQLNQITAFLDGSNVYGSDQVRNDFIRDVGGKLKLESGLLPKNTANPALDNANANPFLNPDDLFLAGDVRANEHVALTAMHTIFVREHNTIVDELKDKMGIIGNPTPQQAEELYQKARAILEGKIQYITYSEFLPILLGPNGITPYSVYDSSVDPQIANEFSTAAYRVGHTMLSTELERRESNGAVSPGGHLSLSAAFFNPASLNNDEIDRLMRGLPSGNGESVDTLVIDDVRNFLFGPPGAGGFDLASLNIQRGRDHGIASYNQARLALGLSAATNFGDITDDPTLASSLQTVYNNDINAVDLWVGGLAETLVPDAMVGETFLAILKDQFERSRDGDRYWYENKYAEGDLTDMELMMIETSSLANIIMRNTGIQFIHQDVYLVGDLMLEDSDFDTVMNYLDNCKDVSNEDQLDINSDGIGDVCEPRAVGGKMILVDTTFLLLTGTQYMAAWLIPAIVSAVGVGIVILRKI